MSTLTGPRQIQFAQFCSLKGAVSLEMKGLKRSGRGPTARAIAIRELNLPKSTPIAEVYTALRDKVAQLLQEAHDAPQ